MTKAKPIVFCTAMVLALLAGIKGMTRRVADSEDPPYKEGDILWVRETWRVLAAYDDTRILVIQYFARGDIAEIEFAPDRYEKFKKYVYKHGWCSPYFMPREAARIYRSVTAVRREALCDISTEDARNEGVSIENWTQRGGDGSLDSPFYREAFAELWDSLNKKRGFGWQDNPPVWAYTMTKFIL